MSAIFTGISSLLSGILTPVMLLSCGVVLSFRIGIPKILQPRRFWHILRDGADAGGQSPWKAMTMALAGTLGVGNITGVAAAMLQGGVGAVFWMWIGALLSMAVKYGEVALAVRYRQTGQDGSRFGGMMYVLRDGWGKRSGAWLAGAGFSLLCLVNALVTGTIVQSNAAADVLAPLPEGISGGLLVLLTGAALVYGIGKVGDITLRLIPVLTGAFMLISLWIIFTNLSLVPSIFREIVSEAFCFPALSGGITGLGLRTFFRQMGESGFGRSLRYGITRGIFSNEAGCGTSPSAHASAQTKSPFHQGCFGIFEVICDTLVLCTMTALVLCIGERRYGMLASGGENLTLRVYQAFGGNFVYGLLAGMVALFAYATILAQLYYGYTALGYFTERHCFRAGYAILTLFCVYRGAVMEAGIMWTLADLVIGVMTCINTAVLFCLRGQIGETVPDAADGKKDG